MIPYSEHEFKIKSLSTGFALDYMYVLILSEVDGTAIFPLPISLFQHTVMMGIINQRGISLLESTRTINANSGIIFEGVCISDISNGEFLADVYTNNNGEENVCKINAGDAVILAAAHRSPIYISETLRSDAVVSKDKRTFSFSLKTLSKPLLKKALDDAVAKEQYEIASLIRDELKHRK